jgi:hypothetical protein
MMAIYHVKLERDGRYSIYAEMRNGRVTEKTGKWYANDKAQLRTQAQNVAVIVKETRKGARKLRGAQDSLGGK